MNQQQFLSQIEEALRAQPGSITLESRINQLEGWDSIGVLSVIAIVDEYYGVTLDAGALMTSQTVKDLAALVAQGQAQT